MPLFRPLVKNMAASYFGTVFQQKGDICMYLHCVLTLQVVNNCVTAFRPMFAAAAISSWLPELPAATTFAVAKVTGLVLRMRSSGVASLAAIVGEFRIWEEIRILD